MANATPPKTTMYRDGQIPQLAKVDVDTFQCPFCPKRGGYAALMAHLQGHQRSIVKYGGYNVYKCLLSCVANGHYHCGFCPRIIVRKELFLNHFKNCSQKIAAAPQAAQLTAMAACPPPPAAQLTPMAAPSPPPAAQLTAMAAPSPPVAAQLTPTAARPPPPAAQLTPMAAPSPPPAAQLTPMAAPSPPPAAQLTAMAAPSPPVAAQLTPTAARPPPPAAQLTPMAAPSPPPAAQLTPTAARPPPAAQLTSAKVLVSKYKKTTCCFCSLQLYKKNLKTHIQRHHTTNSTDITANRHLHSVCIDKKRGIFAVARTFKGPVHCIHVQKCTWGVQTKISCQLDSCNRVYQYAQRSGLVGFDCDHIRSLVYCPAGTNPVALDEDTLAHMVESKLFSKDSERECLKRKLAADAEGAPLSVEVILGQYQGHLFFSVFEPHISSYSRLGRVIVHYDGTKNTWHCPCTKPRKSCPHKVIAKWHLHQSRPDFLTKTETVDEDPSETLVAPESAPVMDYSQGHGNPLYPPEGKALIEMVEYLVSHKALPTNLPKELTSFQSEDFPRHLVPQEKYCHKCSGKLSLSEPIPITKKARIVTVTGIVEGITTYCKRCAACGTYYRYQEWTEGLHNFNDHVILTHHFCLYLRNSVQNHTAVGRVVEALQLTNDQKYPDHDSILHAYLHFEALSSHSYEFSCVNCGHHPPVVILDLHKKGVFSMPMSDLKEPPPEFDGQVDIEDFWHSVNQEILCRGFVKSNAANPCVVKPSYHKWAPWIGPQTRATNVVFNTEYMKSQNRKKTNPAEEAEMDVTEDRLTNEIMNLKVDALRNLVKNCGLDSSGSKMDLILRLREQMKSRSTYDKVFQKVWGASGGWAVMMCPCGVVNAVKFNVRAESPRDYADMLLSFKHLPNVVIYDFARGLATHTNLREPEKMPFRPNEGRLADATPESIKLAEKGELKVNLPWLKIKKEPVDANGHPETGSAEHYVLYDTFHEANTKEPKDSLRKIALVPELCGWVNSQRAEQFFSKMRKNNYFLNMMSPGSHIFLMRCIIHHHNAKVNENTLTNLRRMAPGNITLDPTGKAIKEATLLSGTAPAHPKVQMEQQNMDLCSEDCEALTIMSALKPCRASWTLKGCHPLQEQLVNYILDVNRPEAEIIVKDGPTCLSRINMLSLGLQRDMDAMVGNGCLRLVQDMANMQGKDIFIADLHLPPTWLPPSNCDPLLHFPADADQKEALVIPLWVPGHFLLCVMKPLQKEIFFLDSQYFRRMEGFPSEPYRSLLRGVAQRIIAGSWTEKTALDLEGLPKQTHGNDCGVFMIMYAWYLSMEASFDFTIHDMPLLRRWWCIMLVENLGVEGYGRKFAHFTEEGRTTLRDKVPPVFRISRKRKHASSTEMPLDADDHPYSKKPYSFPPKDLECDVPMDKVDAGPDDDDDNASLKRLVEMAQQAQHQRRLTSALVMDFITQDKDLLLHLEAVITGKIKSPWAKKEDRVIIFFEDDNQVDQVLSFLSKVVENTQAGRRLADQVAFVMDVLLPEATVHALAAIHCVSLDKAKEIYKRGPEYDWSEKQLFAHYLTKNLSEEAQEKIKQYKDKLRRALESEEFLERL